MIIVDTNVISEPLKPVPNMRVLSWMDAQADKALYLAATTFAESLTGIELLPEGRRKKILTANFHLVIRQFFQDRILPFDKGAAIQYSRSVAFAKVQGKSISIPDGQIAAIAAVHGFTVATRDTAPFLAAGVPVINPWLD